MNSKYNVTSDDDENNLSQSNGYRLLNKLGEGTYANVFLAELFDSENSKAPVQKLACKIIDTEKAPRIYVEKFLPRELSILRKIEHPHIVHTHSIYQKSSKYLIFMRFAENGDLLNYIVRTGTVAENQARIWLKQISLAIQYLHEMEIAHRDLKCENILITTNLNVKLTDFGFARYVLNKKGIRIMSETYCGSAAYSAPEILKGNPYNPKVSDIWSLGVILFVMMNKAMPFEEVTVKKLYDQQMHKKFKFKPKIEASSSKQVKDLMQHVLEPNVEKRYNISEVLNSRWIYMDHKILGMNEAESLALVNAKEQRKRLNDSLTSTKFQEKKSFI